MRRVACLSLLTLVACAASPEGHGLLTGTDPLAAPQPPTIDLTPIGPAITGEPLGVLVELPVPRDDLSVFLAVTDDGLGSGACAPQLGGGCLGIHGALEIVGPLSTSQGVTRIDVDIAEDHPTKRLGLQVIVLDGGASYLSAPVEIEVSHPSSRHRDDPIRRGVVATLLEGPGGLDVVEAIGADLVADADLGALLPANPFYENSAESCTNPCGVWGGNCEVCVPWYDISLDILNPAIGSTSLDLDARPGALHATFVVNDASLDWDADATVAGIPFSGSGDIVAAAITVDLDLVPTVAGGVVSSSVSNVSVVVSGFDFDMSGFLGDVLGFFGVVGLIEDQVEGRMRDAIEDAVVSELPGTVDEILGQLAIDQTTDVLGATFAFTTTPTRIDVDDTGLTLWMDANLLADAWVRPETPDASYLQGFRAPVVPPVAGLGASFSVDLLNRALYEAWGAGVLDLDVLIDDLNLDPSVIGALPPGTGLSFVIDAQRAPEVTLSGDTLSMSARDLYVALVSDALPGQPLVELLATASGPVELGLDGTDITLLPGDLDVDILLIDDVVSPDTLAAEEALEVALDGVIDDLLGGVSAFGVPTISGFTVTSASVGREGGYLEVEGDLAVVP